VSWVSLPPCPLFLASFFFRDLQTRRVLRPRWGKPCFPFPSVTTHFGLFPLTRTFPFSLSEQVDISPSNFLGRPLTPDTFSFFSPHKQRFPFMEFAPLSKPCQELTPPIHIMGIFLSIFSCDGHDPPTPFSLPHSETNPMTPLCIYPFAFLLVSWGNQAAMCCLWRAEGSVFYPPPNRVSQPRFRFSRLPCIAVGSHTPPPPPPTFRPPLSFYFFFYSHPVFSSLLPHRGI